MEVTLLNIEYLTQILGILSTIIVVTVVGYKKISKGWQVDTAEASILDLMHKELERMCNLNITLSEEVTKLHLQVLNLSKQLQDLSTENQHLHKELALLTIKITALKDSIQPKDFADATSKN